MPKNILQKIDERPESWIREDPKKEKKHKNKWTNNRTREIHISLPCQRAWKLSEIIRAYPTEMRITTSLPDATQQSLG